MAHLRQVPREGGHAWEVHWRTAGSNVKKQRTFPNRKAAEVFQRRVEGELAAGNSTEPLVRNARTLADVAAACIAADAARLKQKTLDSYDLALRLHILPALGARRVSSITAEDVEGFLADLRAKPKANGQPRSETSILGTYKAVAKVLSYAYRHRLISFNPCVAVRRPKADTPEAMFLSAEEVSLVAGELRAQPPYDLLVRFAAFTGLRAGELGALRIRDINVLHSEVRVVRNMTHTSKGWVIDTPKSARSVRDVPILDDELLRDLMTYLAAHPRRDEADAGLWPGKVPGHSKLSWDYQFDPKGFYRYTFKPAARRAGFPELKLHELRHTFATLALESGALDMHELSRAMGHASYAVTDRIYAHLRRKDYSAHRAKFSAHIARAAAAPAGAVELRRAASE